jgi:hypothetical protein
MRSWIRKPVGAVLLVALLAVWSLAQAPPPFTGRIKVEISPTGAGNISLNPEGDPYGSIYFYTSPTTVWLTASPNSGYAFVRWEIWSSIPASGDPEIRTADSTSITLSTEKPDWTVRAVFIPTYTITVSANPPGGGTVSGGGTYAEGTEATVRATPNACYRFVNWTENGTEVSTNATYTFTVTGNRTLVANFAPIQYTVSVSASPTVGGTVEGGGTYNCGAQATVRATPNACYRFVNWTENGTEVSTNATYTFTVTGNRTLVANFAPIQYTVSVSASPTVGGTVEGGGTYNCGAQATVTAYPNEGYDFVNWTEDGEVVHNQPTYTFTVEGNRNLVAHFTQISYTITATAGTGGSISPSGTVTVPHGGSQAFTITPNAGYVIADVLVDGSSVGAVSSYTFTNVTSNHTIHATFRPVLFFEDFEDITGWTRTGLWHTCSDACSWGCQAKLIGKYAHYAKPGTCSYDTGTTTSGTLTSPTISIPKNTTLALQFDYARYVENYTRASRDLTYVQIRLGTDRTWGSWRTIWSRSSRNPSPECGTFTYTFQTRSYTRLQVRFIFNSINRYNNNFPGWAIDNLIVRVPETAPGALEVTDIGDDVDNIVPETITVYNYPNPVKDVHTTTFVVEGVDAELIRVEVYDLTGKLVWKGEGSGNELTWHTEDLTGLPLANGVYLYQVFVKVGETWIASDVRKLVILR